MTTIVYRYGLLAPTENAETVREQMRLAHRYKNDLIAVERIRRDKSRAILRTAGDIGSLEAAVKEADEACREAAREVKACRASTRSRSETEEMKRRHAETKATLKTARAALAEARRAGREAPEIIAARKANSAETATLTKAARAANGLYWGTGAVVDDAIKAASKEPLYAFGEPCDPKFRRWDGTGSVGIQVHQKGAAGTGPTVTMMVSACVSSSVSRVAGHSTSSDLNARKFRRRDQGEVREGSRLARQPTSRDARGSMVSRAAQRPTSCDASACRSSRR